MIVRRKRTRNFTILENEIFGDDRLSMEAMGVLAWLRSRPDNWSLSMERMRERFKVGRDKMQRVVAELIETGWIVRVAVRDETGSWAGVEYTVLDEPSETAPKCNIDPQPENPAPVNPRADNPAPENPADTIRTERVIRTERELEQVVVAPTRDTTTTFRIWDLQKSDALIAIATGLNLTTSDVDREWPLFCQFNDTGKAHTEAKWLDLWRRWCGRVVERRGIKPKTELPADLAERMANQFWARVDTPQYEAWSKHRGKAVLDKRGGWTFPSEWPPGMEPNP